MDGVWFEAQDEGDAFDGSGAPNTRMRLQTWPRRNVGIAPCFAINRTGTAY